MNSYIKPLVNLFKANAAPEKAAPMKKYMKGLFDYYGLPSPLRKSLQREFVSNYGYPKPEDYENVIRELWQLDEREYQYFAISLAERYIKKADSDSIDLIEYLIINKSWWDSVDGIAANVAGVYFKRFPKQIKLYTGKWMETGNIWLQRTCLLFQLRYKNDTDTELLSKYILKLKESEEFFIRKAIGWILREYSKTDKDFVTDFVKKNDISEFSKKEALKWLKNKGYLI